MHVRGTHLAWGVVVLAAAPTVYLAARVRSDAARIGELLEQSRLGEAYEQMGSLLVLAPDSQWRETPLAHVRAELEQIISQLQKQVTGPLAESATDEDRISGARDLAVLGRTDEALVVLRSSPTLAESPAACNLQGTIYETRGQWPASLAAYRAAYVGWQRVEGSPDRPTGLVQAMTGVAFCQRKLGNNSAAEAAYAELLQLAPTADTHFLLARFYEDTQQTQKAKFHAREAMRLAPERYQGPGERLIEQLVTRHFGCWGAF